VEFKNVKGARYVPNVKIEQDPLWFNRRGEELKEEVAVLEAQLAELEQKNLRSSALIQKLGEYFGFGAAGKLDWARFKLNFKREELDRFEAQPEMLKVADEHCDTVPELPSKYSTTRNLLKGKKMAETHFTDIIIVGNSISRLPRREGKNEDLKRDAATTNQVYRELLRATDEERNNNDEILRKLRF
jgi:hypothetical protein